MNFSARVWVTGWMGWLLALTAAGGDLNSIPAIKSPGYSAQVMGGILRPPARKPSPFFSGKSLPQPPGQTTAWTPPASGLPANYAMATALLFDDGLADPRGCRYCEIEVGTGDAWSGDGGVVKTHGWLLSGDGSPRFGICWNGLVYPLVSAGTNADLDADVALMLARTAPSWRQALPEGTAIAVDTPESIRGCLLLRLGRLDLATNYWNAGLERSAASYMEMARRVVPGGRPLPDGKASLSDVDPYLIWAGDWAWSLFDRMVCAHARGDEKLALLDARTLTQIQPLIETNCALRGFKREPYYDYQRRNQLQPYITFLEQLPAILVDLERRDGEGARPSVISLGITNITDQARRVQAMVRDLDLVQARQMGQPGGVFFGEDPLVSALIGEGDAAVDPLLDCLEHDQRLTRSVQFGRDFWRDREVIPVRDAARFALDGILHAGFSSDSEMRAYWEKYRRLSLEERWYAILADDTARRRWQEAADDIVEPENESRFPKDFSMTTPVPANAVVKMRGEPLRSRHNPSVTELMCRHALEFPARDPAAYDLGACCQMAESLAKWDVPASLPVLRTLAKRVATVMKYSNQPIEDHLIKLSLARARAGDAEAFDDYAAWIVTATPGRFEPFNRDAFEPLKEFPTNAVLQSAATELFGDPGSRWGSLPWTNYFGWSAIEPGLLPMRGYRALVSRELLKTNFFGTITLQGAGSVAFTTQNSSGGMAVRLPVSCQATNGSANTIRWGDWIAMALADNKSTNTFDPFAPVEQRDAAIRQLISQLEPDGR